MKKQRKLDQKYILCLVVVLVIIFWFFVVLLGVMHRFYLGIVCSSDVMSVVLDGGSYEKFFNRRRGV